MGREAQAIATWNDATVLVRALLESDALILRGAIKARFPRTGLAAITADGPLLRLTADGAPLVLELGEKEAQAWAASLLKPQPSLAEKLGVSTTTPAYLTSVIAIAALDEALAGACTNDAASARVLIAVLTNPIDLAAGLALAAANAALPIWCIYAKGKAATPGDTEVRAAFRAVGWVDNKSCAVDELFTATRYAWKG